MEDKPIMGEWEAFEDIKTWINSSPHPYLRGHLFHGVLQFPSPYLLAHPAKLNEILRSNAIDLATFKPEAFPLITDFKVKVTVDVGDFSHPEPDLRFRAAFLSDSLGALAGVEGGWPESYYSEPLLRDHFCIPWGNFAQPYYEFDQGFALLIAEDDGFVYILEGDDDKIGTVGYEVWFKVESERYFSQWLQAIQLCHEQLCE
ncbi:hypothetical protein KDA_13360 [Dictyobacter alpinus]|uniref:Uncharacterized protein n=1 Tax=Dictyobacter alpinus TaxID=2014873 RepID=A0A402B3C5_9CHLR|nr:hypothetical protein [Dictyobacter alpinus]GCE25852.1 hypothetical protein KDA_13360 [Dictyobacter alpinus]